MPPSLPTVSIVVLNWNGKRHLQSCLESLLELDYPESSLELILCDNGSADGSVDFVRTSFPRVRVVALDRNYGFADGNNRAARVATGKWIGFLNNDMRVEPSWIRDMLAGAEGRPNAVCLSSRIVNWDGSAVDFVGGGVNYQGHGFQVDYGKASSEHDVSRRLLFACGGAMLIDRNVFLEVGGFDAEFFAFFEDVDLGWRLNILGHDVWYVPGATAFHRHHGTSSRIDAHRLRVLYERNALAMIYKCFDEQNLAAALPAAMLLLNERALSMAGVDRSQFAMGEVAGPPSAFDGQDVAAAKPSLFTRGRRALRREGFRTAALRTAGWGATRLASGLLSIRGRSQPGVVVLPGVAVSHYIAVSQFARLLESLKAKRQWIQERRKRTDAEILPLFVDPFFASYAEPEYLKFYRWLNRVLELEARFSSAADRGQRTPVT
jgi:GT2 family glycosyltransferase